MSKKSVEKKDIKIETDVEQFPWIDEYREQFPVSENTVFVYKDTIYAKNEMPYDILAHEIRHLQQQQKMGAKKWVKAYLSDKKFRLSVELDAYVVQLKAVKRTKDREEYGHILFEVLGNISGPLYENMISRAEAAKYFKQRV